MKKEFWDDRWESKTTGWDMGQVSPPLKAYIDQLSDKNIRILIPGCGNAYEAQYLMEQGFKNVFIVEISNGAIDSFKSRYPDFPNDHIYHQDFFELKGELKENIVPFIASENEERLPLFDLILEQTFFCAIDPKNRKKYAIQMNHLLNTGGILAGLMFDFPLVDGPPFGGSVEEYQENFKGFFDIQIMERAHNSIEPRQGRELFVKLKALKVEVNLD